MSIALLTFRNNKATGTFMILKLNYRQTIQRVNEFEQNLKKSLFRTESGIDLATFECI